jgi:CubicO group peptidase (beta-lactamase class C family)
MEGKKSIKRQLEDCTSDISNILRLSGSPGLSIGAFNHGRIIHTEHFGFRDSNHGAPPNDHSIYYIASLSKLVAVSAIGTLVQDGLLHWDDEIRHHLPQLQGRKDDFGTKGTIRDLASNRTG